MIDKLYIDGSFNYSNFLIKHTKDLAIDSKEAIVLISMLDNVDENKTLDINKITGVLPNELEEILSKLLDRGFYKMYISTLDNKSIECYSFDGLFTKCELILSKSIEDLENELFLVNQYLEGVFNRFLTATEVEIISTLVREEHHTLTEIKNTVECLKRDRRIISVKNIASYTGDYEEVKPKGKNPLIQDLLKKIK